MLTDRRTTLLWAAFLLAAMGGLFVSVGRHAPELAPITTFAPIGHFDARVFDAASGIRIGVLDAIARFLNIAGAGLVTFPLRAAVGAWLAIKRRWSALIVWLGTWLVAEAALTSAKVFFHRGRPPLPLVDAGGYSFPSGHATAVAATAVALVIVFTTSGHRRRRWGIIAAAYVSLMALSRVYLDVHWLSDTIAGVLLGAGLALAVAALVVSIAEAGEEGDELAFGKPAD